jgi:hypothetical protein
MNRHSHIIYPIFCFSILVTAIAICVLYVKNAPTKNDAVGCNEILVEKITEGEIEWTLDDDPCNSEHYGSPIKFIKTYPCGGVVINSRGKIFSEWKIVGDELMFMETWYRECPNKPDQYYKIGLTDG